MEMDREDQETVVISKRKYEMKTRFERRVPSVCAVQ